MAKTKVVFIIVVALFASIPAFAQESGWIGVSIADQDDRGVLIRSVEPNSPAEKAGLRANDMIVQFGKQEVVGALQLTRLVSETPDGHSADVTVRRDNREQTFKVTTDKAPFTLGAIRLQRKDASALQDQITRNLPDLSKVQVFASPSASQAGIRVDSLTPQLREFFGVKGTSGVLVASVDENSAAAKAGVKAGDVILAVEGTNISTPAEFTRATRLRTAPFSLKVTRDKQEREVRIERQ